METGAAEFWLKRRYDFNVGRGSSARPVGNALEAIWNDEWEKHVVDAALEKVKQQSSAKHYQIFFLQAIKQIPPAKVAETLNVNVDQVYLIKHRLMKVFEDALKELETKLG